MGTTASVAWQSLPLIEVATLQRGYDLPVQDRRPGGIPIFAANGPVGMHFEAQCDGPGVVTGRSGTIGKVHYISGSYWPLNTSLFVKDFHGNHPRYIYWLLSGLNLERFHEGSGVPTLNRNNVHGVKVPVPPLPEQRRIADILDRADALRAKRRAALARLDELTQAIFIEMFGDPVSNPKGWPIRALKDLGCVKTGGTPPGDTDGMFGGAIPFITPGDLESSDPYKRTVTEEGAAAAETVRAGSALVCCIGATIGKMDMARQRGAFNQQINAVEWSQDVHDEYGIGVLRFFKKQIATSGASTTLPILKKSLFEKIGIPVPPIKLQSVFASRVLAIKAIRQQHSAFTTQTSNLFASLQDRAFRGAL